jgi:hypothetical protein
MKLMERSQEAPKEKTAVYLVEGGRGVGRGEWADGLQSPRSLETVELVLEPPPLDRRRQIPVHASSCELMSSTRI